MSLSPLQSPVSGPPQHRRASGWLRSGAPLTIGLLLYIVVFQYSVYRADVKPVASLREDRHFLYLQNNLKCKKASKLSRPLSKENPGLDFTRQDKLYSHLKNDTVVLPVTTWERFSIRPLKIPYPIFMTSLPKSGTTSLWRYFRCGEVNASHQYVTKQGERKATLAGVCIQDNIKQDKPPFEGCGEYDMFSDTGYLFYDHDEGEQCFFPSVDALDRVYAHYPNATFINVIRDTASWFTSLKNFAQSSLFVRLRLCNGTHFPDGQSKVQDWYKFYNWHNKMVQQFAVDHPSLTYIEVELESNTTSKVLEDSTGIPSQCWKKCRPNKMLCDKELEARDRKDS